MKSGTQMSESLTVGLLLALSGGFMDAYSYLCRGHVFANAQTGNILLLGIKLSERNMAGAVHYFCPVIAFTAGIILAELVRHYLSSSGKLHWRQAVVFAEAAILLVVAFIPQEGNLAANSLTSFACGIQVETFRKVRGSNIATTMCIGNLRNGTQYLCEYFFQKDEQKIKKALLYYGTILFFVFGAILGNIAVSHFDELSIIFCPIILLSVLTLMFIKN